MNEKIFKNYLQVERGVLQSLVEMSNTELKKKEEKELKLKQFVQEADEISILEVSDTNAQKSNATSDKQQ